MISTEMRGHHISPILYDDSTDKNPPAPAVVMLLEHNIAIFYRHKIQPIMTNCIKYKCAVFIDQ